ncbi:MAG: AraC family transcriptional regulator [Fusobacteriaceae bacterium]|jgi:predicted transcriptional regulator YdeE|nr:AraC family transcriptional regulator [Fusobacteriaceae bacterium]
MAYQLREVTLRTNNTSEGIKKIIEIWQDIESGKLPILYDTDHKLIEEFPIISTYSNYASDENCDFDFSIMRVAFEFFQDIEESVVSGKYLKYDESSDNDDFGICSKKAWRKVGDEQKSGNINRAFSEDYETFIPAKYAKDGKVHCYLYIAIK